MSISSTDLSSILSSYSTNNAKSSSSSSAASSLGMDDFIQLLVAQMTNQDVMNPMDNTEFIAQMAQFSTLQAMQDLTSSTNMQYASSLVGKNVYISEYNETTNKYSTVEGLVEAVNFSNGDPVVYVNGNFYDLSSVKEIYTDTTDTATTTDTTSTTDTTNSGI